MHETCVAGLELATQRRRERKSDVHPLDLLVDGALFGRESVAHVERRDPLGEVRIGDERRHTEVEAHVGGKWTNASSQ